MLEPDAFRLASRLVHERKVRGYLHAVIARHRFTKIDGPWIDLRGDTVRALAPVKALATAVRPRTYRLDAYRQLLIDLGLMPHA
jgi:hypothetical protein